MGFQISPLFVPDQCSVINRGGTLLVFNGMPPTWAARLAESEVDSPKQSAINCDRHISCLLLSLLCVTVQCWEIAACCTDLFKGFEKQQHECNKPSLNYSHTRFVLDSSVAAWQWRRTLLTYCTFRLVPYCVLKFNWKNYESINKWIKTLLPFTEFDLHNWLLQHA